MIILKKIQMKILIIKVYVLIIQIYIIYYKQLLEIKRY